VLVKRLDTMKSIENMRSTLMDKEVGSRLNLLLSRDARLELESNLARVRSNIADYEGKSRADRKVHAEDFRKTAYQDLVEALAKRDSAAENLKKVELRRQLIVLNESDHQYDAGLHVHRMRLKFDFDNQITCCGRE
jgi:hemolysin D